MFLRNLLLLVFNYGFIIPATSFQSTKDSALKLPPLPDILKPKIPSEDSASALNASAENALNIRCDGETYGYNPNIVDCEAARGYISPDTTMFSFGERHTGLPGYTLPLPYRVMGDRGSCYFQAVLIGDHKTAEATLNMLRRAAAALVVQCATGGTSQGGIATQIGKPEARLIGNGLQRVPHECASHD